MKEQRPIITLKKTLFERLIEYTSIIILILTWGFIFYFYSELENKIPVHFNASGKVDRYGDKQTIFLLPLISTVIFIGLSLISRYPHLFNYLKEITKENASQQYRNASNLLRKLNLIIVLVFAFLVYFTLDIRNTNSEDLGDWFLPAIIIVINLPTLYFLIRSAKKQS